MSDLYIHIFHFISVSLLKEGDGTATRKKKRESINVCLHVQCLFYDI